MQCDIHYKTLFAKNTADGQKYRAASDKNWARN
jgi:hypothetical protein